MHYHTCLKSVNRSSPGIEGANSLEVTNAILLSTWADEWVNLPIDDDLFYEQLQKRIADSK